MRLTKELLYPSHTVHRTLPRNFDQADFALFSKELERQIPSSYFFHFKDCYVTDEGVIIDKFRTVAESLYHESAAKVYGWKYLLKIILKKKKFNLSNQKYFLPFNAWYGYGHWLPEVFPRIFVVKDKIHEFVLLLPKDIPSQMVESLAPFKFKDIFYISKDAFLKVPDLYMTSLLAGTGNYNEKLVQQLRTFLRDFYKDRIHDDTQNVYISRQLATKRKIDNEHEIIPILNKFNFKMVYVESLNYKDQVSLFLNCKCLVSMHGGSLANMIFMQSKSKVLEIQNAGNKSDLCFFSLASALNIDYYYSKAIPVDGAANTHTNNVVVNPVLFEKVISEIVSS